MSTRVAVDLRCLLEPFESGVTVYTKALVDELLKAPHLLELDLFYQARNRCEAIHQKYPQVRHLSLSNTTFHFRCLFGFPPLPSSYFPVQPDLIWLPDRRPFYKSSIPLVMTVHDQVPETLKESLSFKGKLWHFLFSLKRLKKLSSGFLFPSLTVAHRVNSSLPWEVTYEGVKLSSTMEKPKGVPAGDFVLSLAPLDPRKRLNWVFEMAHFFPKVSFVCAGLKEKDGRFARLHLPTLPNLIYLGKVTEPEKKWLLKKAKVLLALSRYEGFDLPVLEAIHTKTPVILSDIAVHRELYKNATYVQGQNDLKSALYTALHRGGIIPEPRGIYTWEKAAERTLLFFFRVLLHKDGK
jgi:glycosyltransferase involved in cell wall biosynthesis